MVKPPGTILVLKPSSFGDVIHTLPAVARLKLAWPQSRISWLINSEWQPLLADNLDIERAIPFPRAQFRGWRGWSKFRQWSREILSPIKPDLALDFQGLLRSAWMGRSSGAKILLGLADAREGASLFYRQSVKVPLGTPHAVERYLALADGAMRAFGRADVAQSLHLPNFPLPAGQPVDETHIAQLSEDFILLHPFARGQAKSLSSEHIRVLCRLVAPRQVVIMGRRGENPCDHFPGAVDLLDQTTLLQLIWLIRRAAFVISVDSGPAHLAAALNRPMVAIHTWSDPRQVGPYCPTAWIWKNGRLFQRCEMPGMDEAVFYGHSAVLSGSDLAKIGNLAISPSGFCA